jgi:hypothetical protein
MSATTPAYLQARDIAVTLLRPHAEPNAEIIGTCVAQAIAIVPGGANLNPDELIADLQHSYNVFAGGSSILDDFRDHKEWLSDKRGSIEWKFWHRYERWLGEVKNWPQAMLRELDEQTDKVLRRLEDPTREGKWDRRGMVVGSVQSGKTGNYTGLICKAADAGYRIIIVLAGMHNNLRSQTQLRLDEGFLGIATEKGDHLHDRSPRKGVGLLEGAPELHVLSLTNSTEQGDFKKKAGNAVTGTLGGLPTLIVAKKNGSILRTLKEWLLHVGKKHGGKIPNMPLLVIDDEADQASINTKSKPSRRESEVEKVTVINRRIREILAAFEKSAYIGYTATPFANIFVNPSAQKQHPDLEDDIFPRSFILNVRPPETYCGPARVFGFDEDPDTGIEGRQPLPLVNIVEDHEGYFPTPHKSDWEPLSLPGSLIRAIRCFILACAIRRVRGQESSHNSMLIHVTRYVNVQKRVADLIRAEFDAIKRRIVHGDGAKTPTITDELESLWREEFESRYATIHSSAQSEVGRRVAWDEVCAELHEAVSRIAEVKEINGSAGDVLDYINHPNGFNVIAVGGDKLSRGLTLEGLSISYFLRTSRMYDTLMQMGRWFGYRPGYLDLCRLFTTDDLRLWYRHIALAEEELRRDLDDMATIGRTPEEYGLRVRAHPAGMLVTAMNKMCHAETLEFSYAGTLVQTAHFDTRIEIREQNVEALAHFATKQPEPKERLTREHKQQAWIWEKVPATILIEEFLDRISIHPQCHTVDCKRVREFIQRQLSQNELTHWTVALVSNTQANDDLKRELGGKKVGLTERAGDAEALLKGRFSTVKANIQSPSHQAFDLATMTLDDSLLNSLLGKQVPGLAGGMGRALFDPSDHAVLTAHIGQTLDKVALALTQDRATRLGKAAPPEPNGKVIRQLRPSTHGLILLYALSPKDHKIPKNEPPYLGLVFSFPSSHTARRLSYKANPVLLQQLRDGDYDEA